MSIYDKASLVLIPSGTKTSKVYSQKPTNGDGDFTFSRSTAATRVNADGNIEKETQNLLLQSNTFDTTWNTSSPATITGGQADKDGGNNAWKLEAVTASTAYTRQFINTSSSVATFSFYAKAGTANWTYVNCINVVAFFDLANGTTGYVNSASIDTSITSVGGGWYRISLTGTGMTQQRIYTAPADNNSVSAVGDNIYIQDAQLEYGLVARDYIETTTAAVEGGITDNVPRLDYTDSSCPALLLEPQRTNLVTDSEYFDDASWSVYVFGGASLTRTFGYESPEGYNNAYKFDVVVGTGGVLLTDNITINPANAQTLSVWMKGENGGEKVMLALRNKGSAGASGDIMTLTSEWARYDVTLTTAAADRGFQFRMLSSNGVVDQTIYVYGAQLEEGSYATSYIPTYGSAVTRNEDFVSQSANADNFSDSEGTIFFDGVLFDNDGSAVMAGVDSGSLTDRIRFDRWQGKLRFFAAKDGSVLFNNTNVISLTPATRYKVAARYKANDYALYVNGVQKYTNTSVGTWDSGDLVRFAFSEGNNSSPTEANVNQVLYFPNALTDQEMIDLTTL